MRIHLHYQLATNIALVALLVGGRGLWLAWAMQGRYPLSALLFDVIALGLLLAALRGFDGGLQWSLRKALGEKLKWRGVIVQTVRLAVALLAVVPFLIATLSIHPQRIACGHTPEQFSMEYEDVELDSDGITLRGWHIPGKNKTGTVVLIAHGVGANKQNFLLPAMQLHLLGYPVMLFDFRAHGDSGGLTTTFGLHEAADVKAAHDWLAARYPNRPVGALAYSMGGAAVMRAAHEYGIFDRIILDSTFSSLRSVAEARYLRCFGPFSAVAWSQGRFWCWLWTGADFQNNAPQSYAGGLSDKSILLIHGKQDSIIPYSESVRLQQALGARAELWLIEGANHVETITARDYRSRIGRFLEERTPNAESRP